MDDSDQTGNPLVLIIENSLITGNAGGGLSAFNSYWSYEEMSVQVSGSTISGNGDIGLAIGGYFGPALRIEDCIITENGGVGIVVDGYGGRLEIKQSRVSGNTRDGILAPSGEKPWYDPQTSAAVENSIIADNGDDGISGSDLDVRDSTIANNRGTGIVSAASYYGGGATTISGSTITGNQYGGILQRGETGSAYYSLEITNTTISGNQSPQDGAGIAISTRQWLPAPDALRISNSTITGNTAEGSGGGIAFIGYYWSYNSSEKVTTLTNAIVAGNRASAGPDLSTSFPFAVDYSLILDPGYALLTETIPGSNLFGLDPLLGPLADNGGLTQTHGLLPDSPALGRGDPNFTPPPAFDQRGEGFDRVVDGRIDIGAVEAQAGEVRSAHAWLHALGDTNADGTPDIAVVSEVNGTSRATVKDAATGRLISQFDFSAGVWPVIGSAMMPAGGDPGVGPRLVLLGTAPAQAETRVALTGNLFGAVTFDPRADPVDLAVLPDQDGNGVQDLATLVTASTTLIAADAVTERVSRDSNAVQGNDESTAAAISADGRFVAFRSSADNLVPGDTNANADIFVHDRETGTTERVSLDSNGTQGGRFSDAPAISADGRFVAFYSFASNLVPDDTNGDYDIFIHDRETGTTERLSIDSCGAQTKYSNWQPAVSADGTVVAFGSRAENLVADDTNRHTDIFVRAPNSSDTPVLCPVAADLTSVEIRDAATGTLSFAAQLDPRQVLSLPDLNGNGSAEVGVSLLSTAGKADRAVIKDTTTGALVQTLWSGVGLVQAAVVPDRNGNGAPEVALLWRNPAAGTTQVWVTDATTSQRLAAVAGFNQGVVPLKLAVVADITGNGVEEYAVLGSKPTTGQVSTTLLDGATGQWVNRIWYSKECTPLDLVSIADVNGNGAAELVMLGRCGPDGQLRAVINDTKNGQVLRRLDF